MRDTSIFAIRDFIEENFLHPDWGRPIAEWKQDSGTFLSEMKEVDMEW